MLLSEADKHLITAGVCGRLSPEEKAALRVLVADSPDAAKLFKALCRDRDALAKLPKQPAPPTVWETVMARIESGPIIVPPKVRRQRAGWAPYAVAASLLVAAGGTAWWYATGPGNRADVADRNGRPDPAPPEQPDPNLAGRTDPDPIPEVVGPRPPVVVARNPAETAPFPKAVASASVFTAPATNPVVFATIDARLPVLFPVAEAADAEIVRRISAEFAPGHALRLDLFAKDTHKAFDQIAAAIRSGGTPVAIDSRTQELQRSKVPVPFAWVVYSESLAAADVLTVLKKLAETDAKAGTTSVWVSGHLAPVSAADGKDAKDLFGLDPAAWKKSPGSAKAPTEPLSAGTADQVATALGKPPTGSAVLTTYLPHTARVPPASSLQIKKFFDDKPAKKDGAVPLLLVIRPAN